MRVTDSESFNEFEEISVDVSGSHPNIIPDHLMRELRERAARSGETLSATVTEALRRGLPEPPSEPLPTHRMGRPKVDVADRDALYRAMEGRWR